jgi:transcriptional regulator with XRE-family HTH domain
MDTEDIKNRVLEFLKTENKSSAAFAQEIGVQPSAISHIISGRNKPSLEFVLKMLNKYPYISTDWLLFGKGPIYSQKDNTDLFSGQYISSVKPEQFDINQSPPGDKMFSIEQPVNVIKTEKSGAEMLKNSKIKKTSRIIVFYNDNTFSEHLPESE